jgi:hypothetical protein
MLERFFRREAILARIRESAFAGDPEALARYLEARGHRPRAICAPCWLSSAATRLSRRPAGRWTAEDR